MNGPQHQLGRGFELQLLLDAVAEGLDGGNGETQLLRDLAVAFLILFTVMFLAIRGHGAPLVSLVGGLVLGFVYAIIALGYTMVYGVLQLINFAHSEVFITGAVVGFEVFRVLAPVNMNGYLKLLIALLAGGGALLDYCCYGACLSRWFIGEGAVAANGMVANLRSHYGDADDNAVITVRFPKAIAILEATWSCLDHGVPTGPIIYGSTGTLVVDRAHGRQVLLLKRGRGAEPVEVYLDTLPEGRATLGQEVMHHIHTGEALHETLQAGFNLEAQAILDAGQRSAKSGRLELVNDMDWCVG